MNILVVYHGEECIDGFTSAWLATVAATQAGHEVPELYSLGHYEGQEEALQQHIVNKFVVGHYYDVIYILDISLTLQCLKSLTKTTKADIVMLDHHKTAFDRYVPNEVRTKNEKATIPLYDGRVTIALNNDMSGAGMTHMYFFPGEEMPLLVQHVQDRDIWKFEMEHTKVVDRYLRTIEQTIEDWTDINAMMCHADGYREVVSEGGYLLQEYQDRVYEIAYMAEELTLAGERGLMVRCSSEYSSDVGHKLCSQSYTFGLTYCTMKKEWGKPNMLRISLRSKGDYDVEVIAKKFGGGGHKNAAGFIISPERFFSGEIA